MQVRHGNGGADDTGIEGNNPAFEYAKNYGSTNGCTGDYANGWYLPGIAELYQIYNLRTNIDAAVVTLDSFHNRKLFFYAYKNFESCYNAFMPTVFNENGYKFFFFSNEGNPLEPCHIHVRKNGALAKFWIADKCSLAENFGFTAKELNEAADIIRKNIKRIKEAWNGFFFE